MTDQPPLRDKKRLAYHVDANGRGTVCILRDCSTCTEKQTDVETGDGLWRVGRHYPIHVYEGDRPVATFMREEDALRAVHAIAAVERREAGPFRPPEPGPH